MAHPSLAQTLSRRLRAFLTEAPEGEVYRARPSQWAAALKAEIRPLLEVLVDGLFAGEVVHHWEVRCPHCGAPHPNLRLLSPAADNPELRRRRRSAFPPTPVQELLTVQPFFDWVKGEALPEGVSLEVRRVGVWVSDLEGSTALYARYGDPQAYRWVQDPFQAVFAAIQGVG